MTDLQRRLYALLSVLDDRGEAEQELFEQLDALVQAETDAAWDQHKDWRAANESAEPIAA